MNDKAKDKKGTRIAKSFASILNGNLLTKTGIVRNMPFLLFITFLCLVYISNGFITESTVRKLNKIDSELKEMRAEFISTKSELMFKSKQSKLEELIEKKGMNLKISETPPFKIVVREE